MIKLELENRLEVLFLDFARYLRLAGLNTSCSEVVDCLNSLQHTGLNGQKLRWVMEATLAKTTADLETLDKLFDLYFRLLGPDPSKVPVHKASPTQDIGPDFLLPGARGHQGTGLTRTRAGGVAPKLAEAVACGNWDELLEMAQGAINSLGRLTLADASGIQHVVRRAQVILEWFMAEHLLAKRREALQDDYSSAYDSWQESLDQLKDYLERQVETRLVEQFGEIALELLAKCSNIHQLDFSQLAGKQLQETHKRVLQLGRKLASRRSTRLRPSYHGRVDLQRTVRCSLAYCGLPLELKRRQRQLARPELVVLCDVSGSVAYFSQFMLEVVYSMQRRFRRVRSFVFVDSIQEVSEMLKGSSFADSISRVIKEARVSSDGFSDFGQAFFTFKQKYLEVLSPRTTLLILADARNNWRPPREEVFASLVSRTRRTYWLNPQPQEHWGREDSVIFDYAPFCHKVMECRNLQQLEAVVREVF